MTKLFLKLISIIILCILVFSCGVQNDLYLEDKEQEKQAKKEKKEKKEKTIGYMEKLKYLYH